MQGAKHGIIAAMSLLVAGSLACESNAQNYPNKLIRVIVPRSPGGGSDTIHVPFKSSGQALESLLGNHLTMQFGGISSARAQIEAGKIRAIAVTGSKRDPSMPGVPTFEEAGVKGVDITSIWGMHAPAATPLALRRVLRDALVEVMRMPEVTTRLNDLGYDVVGSTPEEHDAETRRLVAFWLDLATKVTISAD